MADKKYATDFPVLANPDGSETLQAVAGGADVRVTIQTIAKQKFPASNPPAGAIAVYAADGKLTSITLSDLLDGIANARGSILVRGASGWVALPPGTAGRYLRSGGPAGDPSWAAVAGGGAGASDAADLNYTPTTLADWGGVDPGTAQVAFDELADRVHTIESAPPPSGGGYPMLYDLGATPRVSTIASIATLGSGSNFAFTERSGVALNVQYTGGSSGWTGRLAGFVVPISAAADFHVAALVMLNADMRDADYAAAIGLRNSANSKLVTLGHGQFTTLAAWNSETSRASNTDHTGESMAASASAIWQHVKFAVSTGVISFGISRDGVHPMWRDTKNITDLGAIDGLFVGLSVYQANVPDASVTILKIDMNADSRLMGSG